MPDHRLEQLENEIGSLSAGQQALRQELQREIQREVRAGNEQMMKQMADMIQSFSARFKHSSIQGDGENDTGSSTKSKNKKLVGEPEFNDSSSLRLEFPRYDGGGDPTRWISKVEQYLDFRNIEEDKKVPYAAYYLDGDAQLWYQVCKM